MDARGGAAHVVGDFYKPYHPRYDELLVTDPENASPLTSPDARRWIDMATEHLIAMRADILMESAGRDQADFADHAQRFHDAGYRVQVAILAVHEAHSRLGIVSRYERQLALTGQGRLTARATHDGAYAGILEAADFIDRTDAVDAVVVIRRGNHVVYANQRDQGQWSRQEQTRAAVETERARRWGPGETEQFADTVAGLLGPNATNDWRSELADVLDLARPLAHPGVALPEPAGARPPAATGMDVGQRAPEPTSAPAETHPARLAAEAWLSSAAPVTPAPRPRRDRSRRDPGHGPRPTR